MDRDLALRTAQQYIPTEKNPLKGKQAEAKIAADAQRKIDANKDGAITQQELFQALQQNQVQIDPQNQKITLAQTSLSLIEKPPAPSGPGPRPHSQFPGPVSLGMRDTDNPLYVAPSTAELPIISQDLDTMVNKVTTPDQVARLLDAVAYDTERGKPFGGDGPLGAQAPEATLAKFSGVCRDIHQLGAYILTQNGYEARQMGYVAGRTSHSFLVYKDPATGGYGAVEYGRNYSAAEIAAKLGRPALSPNEALLALRPEAKAIFGWTPPEKGENGYVKEIFYTIGHRLYQETLKLKHQDSVSIDRQRGIELEKTLGEHWSVKAGVNFDSPGDPTAAGAVHAAVGYQWGDLDNWGRVSLGAQYRPNEGSHSVGPNVWQPNPTFLGGLSLDGQLTPFKHSFNASHRTYTRLYGNLSGAFMALNNEEETDGGKVVKKGLGFDSDILTGLPRIDLNLSQHFEGDITPNLSYHTSAFMNNDLFLAAAGYGMGGKTLYANLGVNGTLNYHTPSGFNAFLGGQYLFHQVNNDDSTSVKAGVSQRLGPLSLYTNAQYLESAEGSRFIFQQGGAVDFTQKLRLGLQGQEEIIFNKEVYTNPGSNNIGLMLQGEF